MCIEEEITLVDFHEEFDKWLEQKKKHTKTFVLREARKRQEAKIREERLLKLKEEEES